MEFFGVNPGQRIALYFLGAIAVGTILLWLPISAGQAPVSIIDALFTATSAVCVTGLTVLDTGTGFSFFGQIVILVLIQLGGLGIMTFATALFASLGAKLSFGDRLGLSQSFLTGQGGKSTSLLKAIILIAFGIEFLGAAALFVRFQAQYPLDEAIYYAIFHSISAFCNAGFSTFSNNLESYQGDIPVILVFSILIILGGLGFAVIRELLDKAHNRKLKLSLHSKLCLIGTAALLVLGTIAFLMAEYHNIFLRSGFDQSLTNAFFQSVTSRTAGFNTVPQSGLTEVSLMMAMVLMFIGVCPGSTGGGIKVTTMLLILFLVYDRFKGENFVTVFKRTINTESLVRALTVFILSTLAVVVLLALFTYAEEKPPSHTLSHGWLGESLFEILSAFGTVGLSLGMTPHLHWLGKFILVMTMFAGRVGLLTLAYSLARPPKQGEIVYAEESVMTG